MTTEQTAQQLELAAQILRTGHPWERELSIGKWSKTDSSLVTMISGGLKIRPILATPPDNRPLHNPDNLTAAQVGVGYRLTLPSEKPHEDAELWISCAETWGNRLGGASEPYRDIGTYRLPLSVPWPDALDPYAELKKARAEGKVIQSFNHGRSIWQDCPSPAFEGGTDYRIKPEAPPFQLPQPPPAMQWHRTDVWQEGDLPQGMRPLVLDEASFPTDEIKRPYGWTTLNSLGDCTEIPTRPSTYPCRTRRTLTFTHADKKWTWHRPGDPMPCDGEAHIEIVCLEGRTEQENGIKYRPRLARNNIWDKTLGWRYADEKKTVPFDISDVPPCSVLSLHPPRWFDIYGVCKEGIYVLDDEPLVETLWKWNYLAKRVKINRSIPLTGRWNPDAWEPCHKIISENG